MALDHATTGQLPSLKPSGSPSGPPGFSATMGVVVNLKSAIRNPQSAMSSILVYTGTG
jgi:hypothetical protein